MPIIKKKQAIEFDRPTGPQSAVFADITPIYKEINLNGVEAEQMIVTFQLAATYTDSEGKIRRMMQSEFVRPSLHKKAKLKSWLDGIVGRQLTDAEIPEDFDTEKLIGKNVTLMLIRDENGYSKLQSIAGSMPGLPHLKVENYQRPGWIDEHITNKTKEFKLHKTQQAPADTSIAQNAVVTGSPLDALFGPQTNVATEQAKLATPAPQPPTPAPVTPPTPPPQPAPVVTKEQPKWDLDDVLNKI